MRGIRCSSRNSAIATIAGRVLAAIDHVIADPQAPIRA